MTETRIRDVLKGHQLRTQPSGAACSCGWTERTYGSALWTPDEWEDHLEDVLEAALPHLAAPTEELPAPPMCEEIGCSLRLNHKPGHVDEDGYTWPEPTLTASEVKELTTKATAVALALGRAEAQGECAAMLEDRASSLWDSVAGQVLLGMAQTIRNITRQPSQAASEPLTAPTGHSDPPPTPEARQSLAEGREEL